MRHPRLVLVCALAAACMVPATAQTAGQTGDVPVDATVHAPSLKVGAYARALLLESAPAGQPFAVWASIVEHPDGTGPLDVQPLLLCATGHTDLFGRAQIPIDLDDARFAGIVVGFRAAVLAPAGDPGPWIRFTDVATAAFRAPQVTPPSFEPGQRIRIDHGISPLQPEAQLLYIDGWPPTVALDVQVEVPTGGHELLLDDVAWNEDFARVHVLLRKPRPGQVVTEGFVQLRLLVTLGSRVDRVQLVVDEAGSQPKDDH